MVFELFVPCHCEDEIAWITYVILTERLGIDFRLVLCEAPGFRLEFDGRGVCLPDVFFSKVRKTWLSPEAMPSLPLAHINVVDLNLGINSNNGLLPVLFGNGEVALSVDNIFLGLDVFGSAFFMLSRYEEAVVQDRDEHERFSAASSIAYQGGFLDRPIVDEYVEVLRAVIQILWPGLKGKLRQPRTLVSCDVDAPYLPSNGSVKNMCRSMAGDIIKRRSFSLACQTMRFNRSWQKGLWLNDPYFSALEWMMDVNEKAGNKIAFYFITDHSHRSMDGCYSMNEPAIRQLVRTIAARGHEIGLHASYNSYQDREQTCHEATVLRLVMTEEGINQDEIGGRQHFLRWQTPITARNWEAASMAYDSTLSFADRPGFRCGTCHEYPMYDVIERRELQLRQRPLIVMECSVIADRYMGLGYSDEALASMKKYKQTCHKFGGDFTLLWHNSHLGTPEDRRFYLELIQ